MAAYSYDRRQAGGIDPSEDILPILPALAATLDDSDAKDIAHATYVFDYLRDVNPAPQVKSLADALATHYARLFAGWLGYVFLNRANRTWKTKPKKELEDVLGNWTESIPKMLTGQILPISKNVPEGLRDLLDFDKLDAIGNKIVQTVRAEWKKDTGRTLHADAGHGVNVTYNPTTKQYEIPKSQFTWTNRNKLKDLGFRFDGRVWYTPTLEQRALEFLPEAASLVRGPKAPTQTLDPSAWFFNEWLPSNIERFSKVFTDYGKAEGARWRFVFTLNGTEVTVSFERQVNSIPEAIEELYARYHKDADREGWLQALECWKELSKVTGKASIHAIDRANNLEHSHGAMMEHFPPGVRAWYPKFLDFKYTADIWQMIRAINDEDIRVVAEELMPAQDRMKRLAPPKRDTRTPKGLALEVSSQPGRKQKQVMLDQVKAEHPDLYPIVVRMLKERGLAAFKDAPDSV